MPTIFFPPDDGDGLSCDTYSFGWTSGCVDPNTGLNRGFTQEWYYEENVGAWIAIGPDATGGADLDNVGPTYDDWQHTNVGWKVETGALRKFAFLDPDTGALTFDYIYMHEILSQTEAEFAYVSSTWNAPKNDLFDTPSAVPYPIDGVTLCSNGNHRYIYTQDTTTTSLQVVFRGSVGNPLSKGPSGPVQIINGAGLGNYISTPSGSEPVLPALPVTFDADPGTNLVQYQDFFYGFTLNGPSNNAAQLQITWVNPDTGAPGTANPSNVVKTENYWYGFMSNKAIGDVTANDITTGARGASGTFGLLTPNGTNEDHVVNLNLSRNDFGADADGNAGPNVYMYFAFPERTNLDADNAIYANPTAPSAAGFTRFDASQFRSGISIQNDFNYSENYELFKASTSGCHPNGPNIITP